MLINRLPVQLITVVVPLLSVIWTAGAFFCSSSVVPRLFTAAATWLIAWEGGYCGTVQGVRERNGMGAIQNLGVVAAHRGRGLGSALLLQALHGFRRAGLGRGFLEVTAQNDAAVRLYRRLGFRCRKTVYKAVDGAAALHA